MSLLYETLTNTFSGFNDVGFRNADVITPNIDSLAREGMILSQSYVQPLCTPSRSAFLTGMYPFHIGRQVNKLTSVAILCSALKHIICIFFLIIRDRETITLISIFIVHGALFSPRNKAIC